MSCSVCVPKIMNSKMVAPEKKRKKSWAQKKPTHRETFASWFISALMSVTCKMAASFWPTHGLREVKRGVLGELAHLLSCARGERLLAGGICQSQRQRQRSLPLRKLLATLFVPFNPASFLGCLGFYKSFRHRSPHLPPSPPAHQPSSLPARRDFPPPG